FRDECVDGIAAVERFDEERVRARGRFRGLEGFEIEQRGGSLREVGGDLRRRGRGRLACGGRGRLGRGRDGCGRLGYGREGCGGLRNRNRRRGLDRSCGRVRGFDLGREHVVDPVDGGRAF